MFRSTFQWDFFFKFQVMRFSIRLFTKPCLFLWKKFFLQKSHVAWIHDQTEFAKDKPMVEFFFSNCAKFSPHNCRSISKHLPLMIMHWMNRWLINGSIQSIDFDRLNNNYSCIVNRLCLLFHINAKETPLKMPRNYKRYQVKERRAASSRTQKIEIKRG